MVVNGRRVAGRGAGDHVGEMAALQPAQRRSATVTALEEAIEMNRADARAAAKGAYEEESILV